MVWLQGQNVVIIFFTPSLRKSGFTLMASKNNLVSKKNNNKNKNPFNEFFLV